MYLEVIFALGLWLLVDPDAERRRGREALTAAALALTGAGIIATFTRAGLLAMGGAIVLVGALRFGRERRLDRAHARLLALALVLIAFVLLSRSPEALLARWRSQGSEDWYGATYSAPATLRMRTGQRYLVPVTVTNTGRVVWDSTSDPAFALSYHWVRAGSDTVVQFDGWRTAFPAPIAPAGQLTLPVNVRAPGEAGVYVLVWDVVHEGRAWLSTEGVRPGRSLVEVTGTRVQLAATAMPRLPDANVRADRPMLWRAALRIALQHPLLGVGPDNFRQIYGSYVGLTRWDTRVHANNMYLETLAGAGVAGLACLAWLVVATGSALVRRWQAAIGSRAIAISACLAAWFVIVSHGLVDSFLSFTSTYVMFALAAGLAFSPACAPTGCHADRI
jgi:hypothetical protein